MTDEAVDPLIERGAGGLFLDIDASAVETAAEKYAGRPDMKFRAADVRADNVRALLEDEESFVRAVDAVQIDIDAADAPVLLEILTVLRPRAVRPEPHFA